MERCIEIAGLASSLPQGAAHLFSLGCRLKHKVAPAAAAATAGRRTAAALVLIAFAVEFMDCRISCSTTFDTFHAVVCFQKLVRFGTMCTFSSILSAVLMRQEC
jgi:hypothetical protein